MSTYAYKLIGAALGLATGITLAIFGAATGDEALKLAGTSIASASATAIYTNGRKGTDQP